MVKTKLKVLFSYARSPERNIDIMFHVIRNAQKIFMSNLSEVNYMVNKELTISWNSLIKSSVKN
jgi:hypothetical protein